MTMERSDAAGRVLRIGEVAAKAGVNVQTLRYYERRGLFDKPARRLSGYREYPEHTVQQVQFIKRAQELGFTLDEVHDILQLRKQRGGTCAEVLATARAKIQDINEKIRSLVAIKSSIEALIACCPASPALTECEALSNGLSPNSVTPALSQGFGASSRNARPHDRTRGRVGAPSPVLRPGGTKTEGF